MVSATLDELVVARYAVVVQRDAERWVLAAEDKRALANIELGCMVATDGYDEWVVEVWHVAHQRRFSYAPRVVVWVEDVAAQTRLASR